MMLRRRLLAAAALLPLAIAAQYRADPATHDYRLAPRELAAGVWVIEGAVEDFSRTNGCNIINTGFIVTGSGVLVINTGPSRRYGEQQRAAIARVTPQPVVAVLNLNLHPDYFFGNEAYADVPVYATADTIAGMQREVRAYGDNMYRLCGDWMKGTEARVATHALPAGPLKIGAREFELLRLSGHTASDLVLRDAASGVLFAGGLVFNNRAATTPHADLSVWLASLDRLQQVRYTWLVPSHGQLAKDGAAIEQTRAYLRWIDQSFERAARSGFDMAEVLALQPPAALRSLAALPAEYVRSVSHLYPRYEQRALERAN